jgi:hypothetical protein
MVTTVALLSLSPRSAQPAVFAQRSHRRSIVPLPTTQRLREGGLGAFPVVRPPASWTPKSADNPLDLCWHQRHEWSDRTRPANKRSRGGNPSALLHGLPSALVVQVRLASTRFGNGKHGFRTRGPRRAYAETLRSSWRPTKTCPLRAPSPCSAKHGRWNTRTPSFGTMKTRRNLPARADSAPPRGPRKATGFLQGWPLQAPPLFVAGAHQGRLPDALALRT